MKKIILKITVCLSLVMIFAAASASAQSFRQYKAQIPFDFSVGAKTYPAGEYVINVENKTVSAVWGLQDEKRRNLESRSLLQSGRRAAGAALLFTRSGEGYFLAEMVAPDFGFKIQRSKSAARLAGRKKPAAIALLPLAPKTHAE
jgi:hypothetical protein